MGKYVKVKTALEEKSKEFILEMISNTIESCGNPDLAKSILYRSKFPGAYLSLLPNSLGVSDNEVKAVVSKLLKGNLVIQSLEKEEDLKQIYLNKEVKEYFETEFYGPYTLFEKTRLNPDRLFKAMDSIKDIVEFGYTKNFKFPIEKLEELRQQSHDALNPIKEQEKEFFYKVLGLPRNFKDFNLSFVTSKDPTTSDGYGHKIRTSRFAFVGEFNSLKQAFKIGFDKAWGRLIINSVSEEDKRKGFLPPIEIKKDTGIYQLKLKNMRYSAMEYSWPFQKEVQKKLETIQNKLEKILN